ncbi:MAG: Gfo/Idh/MocA family oxidoreductase [Rubrivivax sp.]|nr:Gfo/Idh/MocA family oxidoreductase [Rubrivivax sp.]
MDARIAVVGAGYFAQFHLEGWRDAGAQVVALCDLDTARAAALAARFGIQKVYGDAGRMLQAERPTLVDVALPPAAQAPVVHLAIGRGVPTICQKPFGTDLAQAEAMAAAAGAAGVPLVVHENFRFLPWFREARRLVDAGHFGRLHGISFRLRPGDGQGPRAYLDRQPYFQAMPQLLVRETAVHFVDTFRFLLGEVRAVTARLRRLNPVIAGEDAGLVIFEFDDDRSGLFDGNRLNDHVAANPRRTMGEMWLEGERGVLRLDGDARLWWKPQHGPEAEHAYDAGSPAAFGGACTALQAHVLRHLRDGAALENDARSYLANLHVQAAIYRSHASGRRVAMTYS